MCREVNLKNTAAEPTGKPLLLSLRELQIIKLNDRVDKITKEEIGRCKISGGVLKLTPQFLHSLQPMTTLTAGTPVYKLRSAPLVYLYSALGVSLTVIGASQLNPMVSLSCLIVMLLGYDIYSGILHVVLDNPENIQLPVLGQACLEFQWHHNIPDDLVRKDFVDVCGDLNHVAGVLLVLNLVLCKDMMHSSSVLHLLGGLKILMAYFGQFSHRSAHSVGSKLSPVAKALQSTGFMISVKDHCSHHQEPYDKDFCLIGICNPIIDFMRKITLNRAAWLALFLSWSIFDIYIYVHLTEMALSTF